MLNTLPISYLLIYLVDMKSHPLTFQDCLTAGITVSKGVMTGFFSAIDFVLKAIGITLNRA